MKLLFENWRQYLKEEEIPAGNITFRATRAAKGFKIARHRGDMSRGGYELEALISYWKNRGVSEQLLQYYRDAFDRLEQEDLPEHVWLDVEYEPSSENLTYHTRGLPFIREYLNERKELKIQNNTDGFTLDLYVNEEHVGQYTHSRDGDTVNNSAEIFPGHRGGGYGTMLLLVAIKAAGDLKIGFEEDTASLTPAMSRIYDELESSGMIFGIGGAWAISEEGEEELKAWLGEEDETII